MNKKLQQAKQMIRPYLRQISDEALLTLTAMADDGQIVFVEACKCIRGICGGGTIQGYDSENSALAINAEIGLRNIGYPGKHFYSETDRFRNLRLLPMCRAEIRRRDRLATEITEVGKEVERENVSQGSSEAERFDPVANV